MDMMVTCSGIRRRGCFPRFSFYTKIWRERVSLTGLSGSKQLRKRLRIMDSEVVIEKMISCKVHQLRRKQLKILQIPDAWGVNIA